MDKNPTFKIKVCGATLKVAMVPYDPNTVIKAGWLCSTHLYQEYRENPETFLENNYEKVKLIPFAETRTVGDTMGEHQERIYLEVLSKFWQPSINN